MSNCIHGETFPCRLCTVDRLQAEKERGYQMSQEEFALKYTAAGSKGQSETSRPEPRPYSTWRHVKGGGLYIVLGVGTCSTNGPRERKERSVIYYSVDYQGLRYRELSEWMDGRFEEVPAKGTMADLVTPAEPPAGRPDVLFWEQWKQAVDEALRAKVGLSAESIPDVDYWGLYTTGDTPEEAAAFAIQQAMES